MCGGTVVPPTIKEKRRNSEKRKEKSRDAARCRRSKESEIFYELSNQLPLPANTASQLDKASVMRLTVGFLKVKRMLEKLIAKNKTLTVTPLDPFYTKVLHGFLLILAEEGNIIYLSENVDNYLGLTQVEMLNHSIFEFAHPCDHDELKAMLTTKKNCADSLSFPEPTSFFIRMKTTMTSKGRSVNLKSASYQVIHYTGHKFHKPVIEGSTDSSSYYLASVGEPILHPFQIDIPLRSEIFLSKHSPDMRFIYVDERIQKFLGYTSAEMVGKSVYAFHHAADAHTIETAFKTLYAKGQCETGYYRFLAKYGGCVWVLTQATLICENTKPDCIVCLNYVLSKTENADEIVSSEQVSVTREEITITEAEEKEETSQSCKPVVIFTSTKLIFTPKEDVMSKNYLDFSDTDLLLFNDTLKDAKLSLDLDLFDDGIDSHIQEDPFINYRDDSLSSPSCCGTPDSSLPQSLNSRSPDHFSTTPSTPDSGSLSDIPNLDPSDEFANLDLKLAMSPSLTDQDCDAFEELDFAFRAPYIPMNMDDDFPLISPSNSVMWGPQEPIPKRAPDDCPPELVDVDEQTTSILPVTPQTEKAKTHSEISTKSSLAALLQSDVKKRPVQRHEKLKSPNHRDTAAQKRWPNSYNDYSSRNNSSVTNKVSGSLQKHSAPTRNGTSSGHIIMLDTIPNKRNTPSNKFSNCHKRNGHNTDHSQSPPLGSHTATVKVNDRLIKVQVSVSELPSTPAEQKQAFSSVPDPPSKRSSPSFCGPADSPKRFKVDNGVVCTSAQAISTDSVLLNLLISGEDASRGYLCSGNSRYYDNKYEPAVISLPAHSNSVSEPLQYPPLLASESELLDSFLNITQYDTDVNAPIQSSHLLQGEDLLNALDQQPLLRDVPALV